MASAKQQRTPEQLIAARIAEQDPVIRNLIDADLINLNFLPVERAPNKIRVKISFLNIKENFEFQFSVDGGLSSIKNDNSIPPDFISDTNKDEILELSYKSAFAALICGEGIKAPQDLLQIYDEINEDKTFSMLTHAGKIYLIDHLVPDGSNNSSISFNKDGNLISPQEVADDISTAYITLLEERPAKIEEYKNQLILEQEEASKLHPAHSEDDTSQPLDVEVAEIEQIESIAAYLIEHPEANLFKLSFEMCGKATLSEQKGPNDELLMSYKFPKGVDAELFFASTMMLTNIIYENLLFKETAVAKTSGEIEYIPHGDRIYIRQGHALYTNSVAEDGECELLVATGRIKTPENLNKEMGRAVIGVLEHLQEFLSNPTGVLRNTGKSNFAKIMERNDIDIREQDTKEFDANKATIHMVVTLMPLYGVDFNALGDVTSKTNAFAFDRMLNDVEATLPPKLSLSGITASAAKAAPEIPQHP